VETVASAPAVNERLHGHGLKSEPGGLGDPLAAGLLINKDGVSLVS
jgi:hypothetical protein